MFRSPLLFSLCFVITLAQDDYIKFHPKIPYQPEAPQWPTKYSVQGTLNLPYAELSEPFTAWFNGETKSSRIDFYGGKLLFPCLTSCVLLFEKIHYIQRLAHNFFNLIKQTANSKFTDEKTFHGKNIV